MNKIKINEKSMDNSINISSLSSTNNKQKISFNKNNILNYKYNSEENSLNKNKDNKNKSINYLNFRQKLFKKCNSQILENGEILPILSHKGNHNNIYFSKINKVLSLNKIPIKLENIYITQNKLIKYPDINHGKENEKLKLYDVEKNIIPDISPRIKDCKNIYKKYKKEDNENNNNKNILINEFISSPSKRTSSDYSEENKNNENNNFQNYKKEQRKSQIFYPFKYSRFYHYSKSRNVSAKKIYEHYISEEIHQKCKPIDNFTKYLEEKFSSPQNKLNKLYGINKSYMNNIKEIKNNKSIAFKEDFNIQEYQRILLGMVKKRIRKNSLFELKQNFRKFNEKVLNGFVLHKGRYTKLAEKLRESAPIYLIDRLKQLDNDKIIEKAKLFKVKVNNKKQNDNILD